MIKKGLILTAYINICGVVMSKATLWHHNWLIGDVPAHIAACEFDCKTVSCPNDRFEHCPRRLAIEKEVSKQASKVGGPLHKKIKSTQQRKKGGKPTAKR